MPDYFSKTITPTQTITPYNNTFETPVKAFAHLLQMNAPYVVSVRNINRYFRGTGSLSASAVTNGITVSTGTTANSVAIAQSQQYMYSGSGPTHFVKLSASFNARAAGSGYFSSRYSCSPKCWGDWISSGDC